MFVSTFAISIIERSQVDPKWFSTCRGADIHVMGPGALRWKSRIIRDILAATPGRWKGNAPRYRRRECKGNIRMGFSRTNTHTRTHRLRVIEFRMKSNQLNMRDEVSCSLSMPIGKINFLDKTKRRKKRHDEINTNTNFLSET